MNEIDKQNYEYLSDKGKINNYILPSVTFSYSYILYHRVEHQHIGRIVSCYFMNEDNQEVAYASLDMFPLCGFTIREEPIIWSEEFLNNNSYVRGVDMNLYY